MVITYLPGVLFKVTKLTYIFSISKFCTNHNFCILNGTKKKRKTETEWNTLYNKKIYLKFYFRSFFLL